MFWFNVLLIGSLVLVEMNLACTIYEPSLASAMLSSFY